MCLNNKINVTIRFSKEKVKKIDAIANKKQSTRSQVIREATEIGLAQMEVSK